MNRFLVTVDDNQLAFLSRKKKHGYSRNGYIRALIDEKMGEEQYGISIENNDSDIEDKDNTKTINRVKKGRRIRR